MTINNKKRVIALAIFSMLALPPSYSRAGAIYSYIVGLSTEITQIANLAQLLGVNISTYTEVIQQIEQLAHEITMIENQLRNLIKLGDDPQAIINTLEQLAGVVQQGQVLSYAAQNIDDQYASLYPGYAVYRTQDINSQRHLSKYTTWSEHNMDNIKAALKAAGVQQETITTERDLIREIRRQSEDAEGNLDTLQAANRLAAQEGESLLSLRELVMTSNQLWGNWMAKEQDFQDIDRAKWEQTIGNETEVSTTNGVEPGNLQF